MSVFVKTMMDKARTRTRALSGQTNKAGKAIDSSWNIQCDSKIRARHTIGSIFVVDDLVEDASGFYAAKGEMKVLLETAPEEDRASAAQFAEYKEFLKHGGSAVASAPEPDDDDDEDEDRITLLSRYKKRDELKPPSMDTGFYVDPDIWYLLIRNVRQQQPTMLIGPTGTGKTELVRILGSAISTEKKPMPVFSYDMGSMYDPISGLLGVHRLVGGESVFDYAKFTKDIQKAGIILLDELSRAPVTTNNILFPCLDARRVLPVEMAGGEDLREVHVHDECVFFATANIGAEYTGTMSMDRALENRFFPVELPYMPKALEEKILKKRCSINSKQAGKITAVAEHIRNLATKGEISRSVSTRETLMVGSLIYDGWPALQAMELVFLPMYEGTRKEGERGSIASILLSR